MQRMVAGILPWRDLAARFDEADEPTGKSSYHRAGRKHPRLLTENLAKLANRFFEFRTRFRRRDFQL